MVVIGAGAAGLVTSYIAAAVKAKVTLVESHKMGGDCLNYGCVPSKALIKTATLARQMRHSADYGIASAEFKLDFAQVMERVAAGGEGHRAARLGRALHRPGRRRGRRHGDDRRPVAREDRAGQRRRADARAHAASSSPPARGPSCRRCRAWTRWATCTSDTLWDLRELPARLVVLGGGPIGCELAQAFARLGSPVTQVEMAPRIMIREDEEVSAYARKALEADGVAVLTGHKALRCETVGDEKFIVVEAGGQEKRIAFDLLLCAVGRVARLQGFGLEELGIPVNRTVQVNEYLQTIYPNILAAGDVAGPFQFTHTAAHQAWYAAVNGLFGSFKKFKADYSVIPWCTFIDPEVARVGLNEQEAKEKGVAYRGHALRHRRPRPRHRRQRGARLGQGADGAGQGPHPRRDHRRRARRRPAGRIRAGHETRPGAEQDPRHHPHLPDAGRGQQVRGRRVETRRTSRWACCAGWSDSTPGGAAESRTGCDARRRPPAWPPACCRPSAGQLPALAGAAQADGLVPLDAGSGPTPAAPWYVAGLPDAEEAVDTASTSSSSTASASCASRRTAPTAIWCMRCRPGARGASCPGAGAWMMPNERANLRTRAGDDSRRRGLRDVRPAAASAVPFVDRQLVRLARSHSTELLPTATVCYVWDDHFPVGTGHWTTPTRDAFA